MARGVCKGALGRQAVSLVQKYTFHMRKKSFNPVGRRLVKDSWDAFSAFTFLVAVFFYIRVSILRSLAVYKRG